jgi:hypothetical protein
MQRESQKDRTILCKYEPTEPGDYRIEVKWSGEHVPGSPFMVMIFDTQEELSRFLQARYIFANELPDYRKEIILTRSFLTTSCGCLASYLPSALPFLIAII